MFSKIDSSLDRLRNARTDLANAIVEAFEGSDSSIALQAPIIPSDRSLSSILAGLDVISEVVSKLSHTASVALVSEQRVDDFSGQLDDIAGRLDATAAQLRTAPRNGGIASFDASQLILTTTNGTSIGVLPQLRAVNASYDAALPNFQFLAWNIRKRGSAALQAVTESLATATSQFSQQVSNAQQEVANLRSSSEAAKRDGEKIAAQAEELAAKRAESEAALEQTRSVRDDVLQVAAATRQSQAEVDSTVAAVRRLKTAADQLQVDLEQFQVAIDKRNAAFDSGQTDLALLLKSLRDTETDIAAIKQRSLDMLSGATVAGLAGVYKTQQNDLNTKLRFASAAFYLSVFILFISATPLIAYVASPFVLLFRPDWADVVQQIRGAPIVSDWQYAGQVFSRLVILLPAAWLMRVTSGRYNSIFRLREHYAHKYTIAASVEGFKRQAPGYESDIAAATFEELLYNPTIDAEPDKHEVRPPHKGLDVLLDAIKRSTTKPKG